MVSTSLPEKAERNQGIEILRIVSMFLIVLRHVDFEIIEASGDSTGAWAVIGILLSSFSECAVNVFAIITGYLYLNKGFKLSRMVSLTVQTLTLHVGMMAVSVLTHQISGAKMLRHLFDIGGYWYFSAYIGMLCFIPLMTTFIHAVSRRKLLLTVAAFLLVAQGLTSLNISDTVFKTGYSTLWLMCMFLIGAYIRKYGCRFWKNNRLYAFIVYAVISVCIGLVPYLLSILHCPDAFASFIQRSLKNYTTLFCVGQAVALFCCFSYVKVTKTVWKKCITFLSTASFAVYIISEQQRGFTQIFTHWAMVKDKSVWLAVPYLLLISTAIYVICACVEHVRKIVFKYTRLDWLIVRISDGLENRLKAMIIRLGTDAKPLHRQDGNQ